jgi:hypothetical protein
MTPREFVATIPGFGELTPTEQVKRFCWYLVNDSGKSPFTGTDVGRCFTEAHVHKPTSVSAFLGALRNQKILIQGATGYVIAHGMNDKLGVEPTIRDSTIVVDRLLTDLPAKLTLPFERSFLEEALICFRHQAFRAAVVMTWNLTYDHFCNWILAHHLTAFNAYLGTKNFSLKAIKRREDFEEFKESEVIKAAETAQVIGSNIYKILKDGLDKRNIAAHPNTVGINKLNAESTISDLIANVVLKL